MPLLWHVDLMIILVIGRQATDVFAHCAKSHVLKAAKCRSGDRRQFGSLNHTYILCSLTNRHYFMFVSDTLRHNVYFTLLFILVCFRTWATVAHLLFNNFLAWMAKSINFPPFPPVQLIKLLRAFACVQIQSFETTSRSPSSGAKVSSFHQFFGLNAQI